MSGYSSSPAPAHRFDPPGNPAVPTSMATNDATPAQDLQSTHPLPQQATRAEMNDFVPGSFINRRRAGARRTKMVELLHSPPGDEATIVLFQYNTDGRLEVGAA